MVNKYIYILINMFTIYYTYSKINIRHYFSFGSCLQVCALTLLIMHCTWMRKPNKPVPLQVAFGHGGYQCNRKQIKTDGYVIKSHNVIQLNLPVRLSLPLFSLPFLPLLFPFFLSLQYNGTCIIWLSYRMSYWSILSGWPNRLSKSWAMNWNHCAPE